jgi:hypothetical protein
MVNRRLSISGRPVSVRLFFSYSLWPCVIVVGTVKWVVAFHSFRTVLLVGTQRCSRAALGGISSQDYSGGLPWRVIAALILLLDRSPAKGLCHEIRSAVRQPDFDTGQRMREFRAV